MGHCDNQTRDSIVPTADSNFVDRNGIPTMDRGGFNVNRTVDYTNTNWMANIPNSRRIGELSIPGTHGSMALHGGFAGAPGDIAINQTMNLETQLNSGIRYIDIRCRHYHNNFAIHHGRIYQHAFFGSHVLEPVIRFLRRNPSETILMRIQEEYNPTGNTRTFAETFESFWAPNQRYFWNRNSDNPTLGEVRGKIILLQQFPSNRGWFGINWGSLDIQDRWEVAGLNDMYNKWIAVRDHFLRIRNFGHLSINHLSGTGGGRLGGPLPWVVSSGYTSRNNNSLLLVASTSPAGGWPDFPRNHPTAGPVFFGGMNVLTTRRIRDGRFTRTGIIAADFPGRGLIERTIALNFPMSPPQFPMHSQIVTALNNRSVLDVNEGTNNVTLWSNHGAFNQRWNILNVGDGYHIASVSNPNLLLTANLHGLPNFNVYVAPHWGSTEQRWIIEEFFENQYIIKNRANPNMVLDVAGGQTNNGANLIVYPRRNSTNQRFFIRP
ncbi:phosphatidylinositol-specific phospholipase C domain-containing protein [Bacillus thuringiensis]|uniref:phosphatidylinositol-specific phospholipase C domain-containing protein n=1 Tax=Bacillus thuringiensis TaxID=1428 RepID=UPI002AB3E203|nr:phosphatidylinositol-specific phospholipase C domain-containing protein [Bacillus thuringiensis]MDY7965379.1 phosphatidylinositol-specific phospholipase C domain-containing protein [Bacillus thuringiensis]